MRAKRKWVYHINLAASIAFIEKVYPLVSPEEDERLYGRWNGKTFVANGADVFCDTFEEAKRHLVMRWQSEVDHAIDQVYISTTGLYAVRDTLRAAKAIEKPAMPPRVAVKRRRRSGDEMRTCQWCKKKYDPRTKSSMRCAQSPHHQHEEYP